MGTEFRKNRMVGFIECGDTFWELLEDGRFCLCRCVQCKRWLWEPMNGGMDIRCGECGCWDQEWVDTEMSGVLYAYSTTNQKFEGAEGLWDEVPYVTAEVEVGGRGGPRVYGILRGPREGLRIGASVVGEIEPASDKTRGYPAVRWRLA